MNPSLAKAAVLLLLGVFSVNTASSDDAANEAEVIIQSTHSLAVTNRYILGNNLIAYRDDPWKNIFNLYGGGIWDPTKQQANPKYLDAVKQIGITVLRWPGGKWRKSMDWKTIMVGSSRQPFGLPEYLAYCELIGAKPIITLSAEFSDSTDIPALIAYLNLPLDNSKSELNKWALQRALDGRTEPWNVEWFEFGNENFNSPMSSENYIKNYKAIYSKIKDIDPKVKLGAVLGDSDNMEDGWTYEILNQLGSLMDFGIIHPYIPMVTKGAIERLGMDTMIRASLFADATLQYRLDLYQKKARELGRTTPLPLAATEYNAHFIQNNPVPIRHTLSTALHNADWIRIMLSPENHIALATYWHLGHGYWGMLKDGKQKDDAPLKTPNYYVYSLYSKYMLDDLVELSIQSPTEEFSGSVGIGPRVTPREDLIDSLKIDSSQLSWSRRLFSSGDQTLENGILSVEFLGKSNVDYRHAYKVLQVKPNTLYRVSVKVRTSNIQYGKVGIVVEDIRGWNATYHQPGNVYLSGTHDWQWVSVDYRTSLETKKINVIPRKYKNTGPTSGIAEFGELKIQELPGSFPAAKTITGIGFTNKSKTQISVILINKSLLNSTKVKIKLPESFHFTRGEALIGASATATISDLTKTFSIERLDAANETYGFSVILPPHSMAAIMSKTTL